MKHTIMLALFVVMAIDVKVVMADDLSHSSQEALIIMDQFLEAFNERDIEAWSKTLNYPHVRFASGQVKVWENRQAFVSETNLQPLIESGWNHSRWLRREVVLSSPLKVHISTSFERYDKDNQAISAYESLYIITKKDNQWGIQARSSLAP